MRFAIYLAMAFYFSAFTSLAAADEFGAIAYDLHTNGYGVTWDNANQGAADSAALSQCSTVGSNCFIAARFVNQCGAYATGPNEIWGSGYGGSRSVAESAALFYCNKQGTGGCRVRVWGCNSQAPTRAWQGDPNNSTGAINTRRDQNRSNAEAARQWGGQEEYNRVCSQSADGCSP